MKEYGLALGSFDGLHRGHMRVIEACIAVSREKGLTPAVMLFDRHPLSLLSANPPGMLLTRRDRQTILTQLGVETLEVCFSDIMHLDAQGFVDNVLKKRGVRAVCCGFNYRFARNRQGDADTLTRLCSKENISVRVSEGCYADGSPISSTRIRAALREGNVRKAGELLGRNFLYTGTVIHGDHRGTTMGFPTANQRFENDFTVPKYGVYASASTVNGIRYPSVTNVGIRPTVGGDILLSETNILGFQGDIYGKNMTTELIERIRGEITFPDFAALSRQISLDVQLAREIYEKGFGE